VDELGQEVDVTHPEGAPFQPGIRAHFKIAGAGHRNSGPSRLFVPAPAALPPARLDSADHGSRVEDAPPATRPARAPRPTPPPADLRALARRVEMRLARRVVGQDEAVDAVARAVKRAAVGLGARRGPLARLLFVGPTGTGKTELARALADELGGGRRLLRVDCSEFGSRHESAKLLGAPPGYVGHERGGVLGRRLAEAGECVVLFDEIEKGHAQLHELLLQVLDEGQLTDGRGEVLDFRRAFVILTSNSGTRELAASQRSLGFTRTAGDAAAERETVARALGASFAPEFLARLDEVVLFRELSHGSARAVAGQALLDLALRVRARGLRVCFTAAVARWAAEHGATGASGARGIVHCVRREIEAPLAEALLAAAAGEWITVSIRRGRPHFAHST